MRALDEAPLIRNPCSSLPAAHMARAYFFFTKYWRPNIKLSRDMDRRRHCHIHLVCTHGAHAAYRYTSARVHPALAIPSPDIWRWPDSASLLPSACRDGANCTAASRAQGCRRRM